MQPDTDLLDRLFRLRVKTRRPLAECAIDWAAELLGAGQDAPSLLTLAGLSTADESSELEGYLRHSLKELGLKAPDRLEERLREARALASAALSGDIDVIEAVSRIHEVANGPLNHPPSLQAWCDLDGGFTADAEGVVTRLSGEALVAAARSVASSFVSEDLEFQLKELRSYAAEPQIR